MTDPLVERIDELVDGQAATVGVLDEGLRALVRAFEGTQRIAGRDGRDGQDGQDGLTGATGRPGNNGAVVFVDRSFFQSRRAVETNGAVRRRYLGHAFNGTDEGERGWYIERLSFGTSDGLLVEASTTASWADRANGEYVIDQVATAAWRAWMADLSKMRELTDAGESDGLLSGNDALLIRKTLTTRSDEWMRLIDGASA